MKIFFDCLSYLASFPRRGRGQTEFAGRRPQSFRPALELLETREVPSTVPIAGSGLASHALVGAATYGTTAVYAPVAPAFTATAASGTQVNLAWGKVANANGYLVDEWINGAWKQIGSMGSTSIGASITGLTPSTTYYFDVASYNTAGTTWASYKSVTTLLAITVNHPTASTAYSPVSGSLFGPNGPSYLDVQQGTVGDCWLLSSLAEVAARAPQDIRSMFTYDGTTVEVGAVVGVYTVRLFDNSGVAHNVIVDTELPAGGGTYDHPANGILWVALAEKAYAEANGAGFVTTGNKGSDSYNALNEGDPAWALRAITGKAPADYAINPTNIAAAWNAGDLIVLCTSTPASSYVVGGHCYAVVGYNVSSSQPFSVYNPWGTTSTGTAPYTYNNHQVYGLFSANAAFLSQNFATQAIGFGTNESLDEQTASTRLAQQETSIAAAIHSLAELANRHSPGARTWDSFWAEAGDPELATSCWGPC